MFEYGCPPEGGGYVRLKVCIVVLLGRGEVKGSGR